MRVWEIKDWQNKKLRRACWNKSLYCSFTPNRGWDSHCAGQVIDFDSNLQYFFGVMSENDIEEYVEPTKQCEDCATESIYCGDCPDKVIKKEEPVMEKRCDNCGWSGQVCNGCFRKERLDNWMPKTPAKTKDLTWMEAKEAWDEGWQVSNPRWHYCALTTVSFESIATFYVSDVLHTLYTLTGNRRK